MDLLEEYRLHLNFIMRSRDEYIIRVANWILDRITDTDAIDRAYAVLEEDVGGPVYVE